MTIARRQRQRSVFLTSLTQHHKDLSFRNIACLTGFFFILIGFFWFLRPLPYNATSQARRQVDKKGQRLFTSPEDLPIDLIHSLDAILVLGGGRPSSINHPPIYVERRCDDAVEVVRRRFNSNINSNGNHQRLKRHKQQQQQQLPVLCLSAGTAHLPQLLSADGLPIWESTACAAYILSTNNATMNIIPPESIFVETSSYDTIGNAYFARTTHTEFNGWRKLLIITNEFHMARTVKIFDWIFSIPTTATTAKINELLYHLHYLESPNVGMASEVVAARKEREASSSNSVDYLSKKYSMSLRDVYEFLTQEHALYTANRLVDRGRATAADVEGGSVKDVVKRSYGVAA